MSACSRCWRLRASRLIQGFDGLRLPIALERRAKGTNSNKMPPRAAGNPEQPFSCEFAVQGGTGRRITRDQGALLVIDRMKAPSFTSARRATATSG